MATARKGRAAKRAAPKPPLPKHAAPKGKAKAKTKRPPKKTAAKRRSAAIGEDAVKRATGKSWKEWFALLDKAGAATMAHRDIAKLLSLRHEVADWWSQMVTVAYERARGLRKVHQTAGGFTAGVSRTLATGLDTAFAAWDEASQRASFLKEVIALTTRNPGKNLRFKWDKDGGRVEVRFVEKGANKAQITIDHSGLASAASVKRMKAFWAETLTKFEARISKK